MSNTIAFIGAGNMARSLIGGLVASGQPAATICATDPNPEQRAQISATFGIQAYADNTTAIAQADTVVLAVKPQVMRDVAETLASTVQARRPLVLSIAAGIRAADLENWLGGSLPLVRCMPNTPALIQSGATGLYANPRVSAEQRQRAQDIMATAGITVWVDDESLLDAVTALSGSGPAYFFLVMEALEQAGEKMGLEASVARQLALHTALGAAKMAIASDEGPAQLRTRVTSPGGTTERAISILQQGDLEALFERALQGAKTRCQELSDQLGNATGDSA
ncbi:MAG: pyrroline-5-carboxylate reductase [Candidatus Competibacteraceae bacterium]|nr:pyrroline-5-carboxylate reductase [Candidatus Competibacteraceae bacterium]MCB1804612.1 pyrroline-5-carboxylate reductase [Candidatus Competibacteraceae bacterium]MCB1810592.1 pyrroline-5-carboxylate reductase [Candidatus Competibacteraceae bacterium]